MGYTVAPDTAWSHALWYSSAECMYVSMMG